MKNENEDRYDLSRMIIQPLYFGLVVNILIPAGVLLACHYIHSNYTRSNAIGDLANPLFYVFVVLALLQAGLALWWRSRRLQRPMIKSETTMESDLTTGLLHVCRPVFVLITAISGYGYIYFFLTGRFTETVVFVFFSFVVFQVIRPRQGFARKFIDRQQRLFEQSV